MEATPIDTARRAARPSGADAPALDRARERQLLAAVDRGDRGAAEELVDRTYGSVYASLYRLTGGDADLAADLTQETYRKAWAALERFDRRSQLATWLYRIAYNAFLNHIRRPRRLLPLAPEREAAEPDPAPGADEMLGERAAAERLRREVLALPEDLRFTVTARFWGGRSVKEIAGDEQVTPVAIRKRLKRAYQRLALALEEDG